MREIITAGPGKVRLVSGKPGKPEARKVWPLPGRGESDRGDRDLCQAFEDWLAAAAARRGEASDLNFKLKADEASKAQP